MVSAKKLESTALGIVVDDAHDLLSSRILFFAHDFTQRCKTIVKSSILLQKVVRHVGPYSKVASTFEVVCFRKSVVRNHCNVPKIACLQGALGALYS